MLIPWRVSRVKYNPSYLCIFGELRGAITQKEITRRGPLCLNDVKEATAESNSIRPLG